MVRASKSIERGLREALAYAKGELVATTRKIRTDGTLESRARPRLTPLQKSIRKARKGIETYLAGDASRIEISIVKVESRSRPKNQRRRVKKT